MISVTGKRLLGILLFASGVSLAAEPAFSQVPVDDSGRDIGASIESLDQAATGNEGIPLLPSDELQTLVGPIALYPDDLLAIVLPASTYPLQVVQAARFLDDLETDPGLKPAETWDDSIVALINYPEIVELLNEDLDWTWQLGEAVVAQQADVIAAVKTFRDRAYAAGNLQSDGYQNVARNEGVIEITPVADDVIYVPYYEPERVIVRQSRPVYYYYPEPCPVYYYPYASNYSFNRGFFWGVTTAFSVGWFSDRVHVIHHSYRGHPYYAKSYRDYWWYRRPTVQVHNTVYVNNTINISSQRYHQGDYWRSSNRTRLRSNNQQISRSYYNNGTQSTVTRASVADAFRRQSTTNRRDSSRTGYQSRQATDNSRQTVRNQSNGERRRLTTSGQDRRSSQASRSESVSARAQSSYADSHRRNASRDVSRSLVPEVKSRGTVRRDPNRNAQTRESQRSRSTPAYQPPQRAVRSPDQGKPSRARPGNERSSESRRESSAKNRSNSSQSKSRHGSGRDRDDRRSKR